MNDPVNTEQMFGVSSPTAYAYAYAVANAPPSGAASEAYRSAVSASVEMFLDARPKWREIGEECSSGGAGLCEEASHELAGGLAVVLAIYGPGVPVSVEVVMLADYHDPDGIYPDDAYGSHWVVEVVSEGYAAVVDLTPRQWNEDIPFPYIAVISEPSGEEVVSPPPAPSGNEGTPPPPEKMP